ncbi:MAG: condensation domain-containing protein [Sulfitobacter sp.]
MSKPPFGAAPEQPGTQNHLRFPCTHTQLRCWVIDKLSPGNPALNVVARWTLRGRVVPDQLEQAFAALIERHEILRTRFIEIDGTPMQEVVDAPPFKLSIFDLCRIDPAQQQTKIDEIAAQTTVQAFDLAQPHPLRAALLALGPLESVLLITGHQACFDGWSIGVLGRELGQTLAAIAAHKAPDLPELPLQFGDYALWQQDALTPESLGEERAYWSRALADLTPFEVPRDVAGQPGTPPASDTVAHAEPAEFGQRMEAACRQLQTSPFALGVAVLSALLHRATGQTDVSFGTQVAGRDEPELEHMIGVFINNLVLRAETRGEISFAEHLGNCTDMVTQALAHRRLPFEKLVELLNPPRRAGRNPLISVNYILQQFSLGDHAQGDVEFINTPSRSPAAVYDLNFVMVGRPSGWRFSLEFDKSRYSTQRAAGLLAAWRAIYAQVLDDPSICLNTLPGGDGAAPRPAPRQSAEAPRAAPLAAPAEAEDLHDAIGQIWAQLLGSGALPASANFFEIGGHSLLALRMISRLKAQLNIDTNLAALFAAPSLGEFAQSCARGDAAAPALVLPGNPWRLTEYQSGDEACLFTINHPFLYYGLARLMPPSVALRNLNLFDVASGDLADIPFETLAAEAVQIIETSAGQRPIGVLGLCVNGRLAAEISAQLRARGHGPRFTGIIDGWAADGLADVAPQKLARMGFVKKLGRARYFSGQLLRGRMTLAAFVRQYNAAKFLLRLFNIPSGHETPEEVQNREVSDLLVVSSLRQRESAALDGSARLFASRSSLAMARSRKFGWKSAAELSVIEIDGWHEDSLHQAGIRRIADSATMALTGARPHGPKI